MAQFYVCEWGGLYTITASGDRGVAFKSASFQGHEPQWDNLRMTITYKDAQGIEGMRIAGKLASEVLDFLTPHVVAGVTTNQLDKLAYDYITQVQGAIPAPLNYNPSGTNPYPKSICTSINHQVCHGIPNDKPLKKADIVNIDITVIK